MGITVEAELIFVLGINTKGLSFTMDKKYVYIVISRTQTKFAKCIRCFGKIKYNHSAIGLDADLKELYAFSRPRYRAIFLGRLDRETLNRYTMDKDQAVPVVVFKLPVSSKMYYNIRKYIEEVSYDSEYMYNLFSVLTYPITHGFATYKTFNCTEFVAHLLKTMNYPLDHPAYRYKPDDFLEILKEYIIFDGDLREYMKCDDVDEAYFSHLGLKEVFQNFWAMLRIIGRTYFS